MLTCLMLLRRFTPNHLVHNMKNFSLISQMSASIKLMRMLLRHKVIRLIVHILQTLKRPMIIMSILLLMMMRLMMVMRKLLRVMRKLLRVMVRLHFIMFLFMKMMMMNLTKRYMMRRMMQLLRITIGFRTMLRFLRYLYL